MSQNDFLYLRVRSTQNNAIVFNGKRLKGSVLTTSIQHSIRDFSQGSQARKINKKHKNWKGRNEIIWKWHDLVY